MAAASGAANSPLGWFCYYRSDIYAPKPSPIWSSRGLAVLGEGCRGVLNSQGAFLFSRQQSVGPCHRLAAVQRQLLNCLQPRYKRKFCKR